MQYNISKELDASLNELEITARLIRRSLRVVRKKEVRILRDIPAYEIAYKAAIGLNGSVDTFKPLTASVCLLGKVILTGYENPATETEEEIATRRLKVGWHICTTLFDAKVLKLKRGRYKTDPYFLTTVNKNFLDNLFYIVDTEPERGIPVYLRPSHTPPAPFDGLHHKVAGDLVRRLSEEAKEYFKIDEVPLVYEVINKQMLVPHVRNKEVLDVIEQSMDDDVLTMNHKKLSKEQRDGMMREVTSTINICKGVGDGPWWQYMFYDNRSRKYVSSVFYSTQGSKLSKSLIKLYNKKRIGLKGLYCLLVHAANCWGYDKKTIGERARFTRERLDEWLACAQDAVNNKMWQKADSPFEFLAVILELKNAFKLENPHNFESGLIVAWDATCSGLQIFSALSRDEVIGKLCNLTDKEIRGDYYKFIKDHVWDTINPVDEDKDLVFAFYATLDNQREIFKEHNKAIKAAKDAKNKELTEELLAKRKVFTDKWGRYIAAAAESFWASLSEQGRSIVKRGCMTYLYSCGVKTMSKQLFNDHSTDTSFFGITKELCYYLAAKIFYTCVEEMPGPTEMMGELVDMARNDFREGKDFTCTAPVTGFRLHQNYRNSIIKKVKVSYGDKRIKLGIVVGKGQKLDYQKICSSTPPNVIHMYDSQIVAQVILDTDYDLVIIHDSFGACAADAWNLYNDVRKAFNKIFIQDQWAMLCEEKNFKTKIKYGNLLEGKDEIPMNQQTFS